jgi:aminopeptidase N
VKYFLRVAAIIFLPVFLPYTPFAQYTSQDSLRGSIGPGRDWWDVKYYDLSVVPDYSSKTIKGKNIIRFEWLKQSASAGYMQIDLQQPMMIDSVIYQQRSLKIRRNGNAWMIDLPKTGHVMQEEITIYFHGKPREAPNAPWDGGWVWTKDEKGRPWMTVACQGLGASIWYPCKDHQSDEPDNGAELEITVADSLVAVGNGRLKNKIKNNDGTTTWQWAVTNPINNYNIVPYIGSYSNWSEKYQGEKGNLDCSYWVMDYNLEKSKQQFSRDVPAMLKCFEDWFGPYPFYEDSYKMVETPHLGMEHQSSIAYGNRYRNGYLGIDRSGTGWGAKWDYIIIHESGHEWFGNNITTKDVADMWIQEGFTTYSETLFTECQYGKKAADEYTRGLRRDIRNDSPLIGPYGVNKEGSSDMYDKGSSLVHMIRQVINNDSLFKKILRGLNKDFYHQTITSTEVERYFSTKSGMDLSKIFNQYLRTNKIPVLEYKTSKGSVSFRWTNCVADFAMPLRVTFNKGTRWQWINPRQTWQTLKLADWYDGKSFLPDDNFFITLKKVL